MNLTYTYGNINNNEWKRDKDILMHIAHVCIKDYTNIHTHQRYEEKEKQQQPQLQ